MVVNRASVDGVGGGGRALGKEDEVREALDKTTELCRPSGFILNDTEQILQYLDLTLKIKASARFGSTYTEIEDQGNETNDCRWRAVVGIPDIF